jgi:hypothetical protein
VEDIYFVTSFLGRGEVPNFQTHGRGVWSINDYINSYFDVDTQKSVSQVPIKQITYMSFQVILYIMVWIVVSNILHLEYQEKM